MNIFYDRLFISHRFTHHRCNSFIEWIWEDMFFIEISYIIRKCFSRANLHLICDFCFSILENSLKNPWKCENIVNLIWIIRSPSSYNPSSSSFRQFWHNLRSWIRHRKNNRIFCHRTYHIFRECSCGGYSEKYIRSYDRIRESSSFIFEIRKFEDFLFRNIEIFTIFVDDTFCITSKKVSHSIKVEKFQNGDSGSSNSVKNYTNIFFLSSCNFQRIYKCCKCDDRSSMLIIMHNRNIEFSLQSLFDLETSRS